MTRARYQQVSTQDTPYYHCSTRCVRRAFLCGKDPISGKSYNHRRQWILDRPIQLQQCFTIELYAYAVMSNHYHLVVRIDERRAMQLNDYEVIERWSKLHGTPDLIKRFFSKQRLTAEDKAKSQKIITTWRKRLPSLSWFMKCLNEFIARRANAEDDCKGHFWEARFESLALLDEPAVLTCMSYVDLNPIRAGISKTPEASDFTSIQARIVQFQHKNAKKYSAFPVLAPLEGRVHQTTKNRIHFSLLSYLELVDLSGRSIRNDKPGFIHPNTPPILQRLHIDPDFWVQTLSSSKWIHKAPVIGQRASRRTYLHQHKERHQLYGCYYLEQLFDH